MCGRTSLAIDVAVLEDRFDVEATAAVDSYVPAYNISPGDGLVTIANEDVETADVFDWGFIPHWADEPEDAPNPINARSETVASNNMFRQAFQDRRCLIAADGFYEWAGSRGSKQPYRICREDESAFAFAGIWSRWKGPDGDVRNTTAILTTDANELVEPIHDRMPVILEADEESTWLSGGADEAMDVLDPHPVDPLQAYPVAKTVNDPTNDVPELFDPIDIGDQSGLDEFAS